MHDMKLSRLYAARFGPEDKARKNRIWQVLCRHFFQDHVDSGDTVLDIGGGYCEFINHIVCRRRIALDLSEEVLAHAGPGVEVVQGISTDLSSLPNELIDVVFTSNFFEHLLAKQDLLRTLAEVLRVQRPGGRLLILQPNIRHAGGAYWDFFDHHLPLTERSLVEALEFAGLKPTPKSGRGFSPSRRRVPSLSTRTSSGSISRSRSPSESWANNPGWLP